jgi:hypothetical protein
MKKAIYPILVFVSVFYVLSELWFITMVVNTISLAPEHFEASNLELVGRALTGIGCAISVLAIFVAGSGRTLSYRLNGIHKAWLVAAFVVGFFGVKAVINLSAERASDETLMCSSIGSLVRSLISDGERLDIERWADENEFYSVEEFQLGLVYAPAATCFNSSFYSQALSDPLVRKALVESSLNSKTGRKKTEVLKKSVTSLFSNFDQIYTGLIKVERSWNRNRAIEQFYDVAWKKKIEINPIVFDRVFKRNRPFGRKLTKDQAFKIVVEEILNTARIELDEVSIHRKMPTNLAIETLLNDAGNHELIKLDDGDFSSAKGFLEQAKLAYKTTVVPVILISVSTTLIILNLVAMLLASFKAAVKFVLRKHSLKLNYKSNLFILFSILVIAIFLPSTRTQSSILGTVDLRISNVFIWFGYRTQSIVFPELLNLMHENSIPSNPFWYTRTLEATEEIKVIKSKTAKALEGRRYLTPIADSAAWYAMKLKFLGNLNGQDSAQLQRAFEYYTRANSSEEQFLLKANYAKSWVRSTLQ